MIPTFAADGRRLRNRSLQSVENLLALSMVVVRRGRRGQILAAQFRPLSGANPLRHSALSGTRYSFHGQGAMRMVWSHRDHMGAAESDFQAVPLSCSKVVSIETGRRPKPRKAA